MPVPPSTGRRWSREGLASPQARSLDPSKPAHQRANWRRVKRLVVRMRVRSDVGKMTGTKRRNYKGEPIRDGEHGKKCPSNNCNVCGTGWYKRVLRRLARRQGGTDD